MGVQWAIKLKNGQKLHNFKKNVGLKGFWVCNGQKPSKCVKKKF